MDEHESDLVDQIAEAMQGPVMIFDITRFLLISSLGEDKFQELYKIAFTRILNNKEV